MSIKLLAQTHTSHSTDATASVARVIQERVLDLSLVT